MLELDPSLATPAVVFPAPPAPTVTVYVMAEIANPDAANIPPAPPPPPPSKLLLFLCVPPPPATTRYSTLLPSVGFAPSLLTVKVPEPLNVAIL
jgi:hypothetical protein